MIVNVWPAGCSARSRSASSGDPRPRPARSSGRGSFRPDWPRCPWTSWALPSGKFRAALLRWDFRWPSVLFPSAVRPVSTGTRPMPGQGPWPADHGRRRNTPAVKRRPGQWSSILPLKAHEASYPLDQLQGALGAGFRTAGGLKPHGAAKQRGDPAGMFPPDLLFVLNWIVLNWNCRFGLRVSPGRARPRRSFAR